VLVCHEAWLLPVREPRLTVDFALVCSDASPTLMALCLLPKRPGQRGLRRPSMTASRAMRWMHAVSLPLQRRWRLQQHQPAASGSGLQPWRQMPGSRHVLLLRAPVHRAQPSCRARRRSWAAHVLLAAVGRRARSWRARSQRATRNRPPAAQASGRRAGNAAATPGVPAVAGGTGTARTRPRWQQRC
jgi:hypothetical protein